MIASRRRLGTTWRKSSSRLRAASDCWTDSPVTLPPGRARLTTRPPPTGSTAIGKTMGIADVACFTVETAVPFATMTSTTRPRSRRCAQVVPPTSDTRSRWCGPRSDRVHAVAPQRPAEAFEPRNPIVGSLPACCASGASGHAAAAPPIFEMKSRRLIALATPSKPCLRCSGKNANE
jgi:hypothetical protein